VKTRRYGCRLAEHYHHDTTDAILGGVADSSQEEGGGGGDVVAVFGEIVEDPNLAKVAEPCDDPTAVRDEAKRLNRQVLEGFVKLVQDLVNRPVETSTCCTIHSTLCLVCRPYFSLTLDLLLCHQYYNT